MINEKQDAALYYIEHARRALGHSQPRAALLLSEAVLTKEPLSLEALQIVRSCWKGCRISVFRRWQTKLLLHLSIHSPAEKRIRLIERQLLAGVQEPFVYQALADAAEQLRAWPMMRFSYEVLVDLEPQSIDYIYELARVCLRLEDVDATLRLVEEILAQAPAHLDAQALAREAAVFKAMREPMSIPRGGRSRLTSCP